MNVAHQAARGVRGHGRRGARARRGLVAPQRRLPGEGARPGRGRRLHREQVIEAPLARHACGRGRAAAAQGRALRPPGARATSPASWCCATRWWRCCPDAEVDRRPARAGTAPRRAGAGRRVTAERGGRRRSRRTAGRCCPTTSTSRGPQEPREVAAAPAPGPAAAGRPVGGAPGERAGRRAGPPRAGPGSGGPRRPRGALRQLRAAGPGAAARARHRALPRRRSELRASLEQRPRPSRRHARRPAPGWSVAATSATGSASAWTGPRTAAAARCSSPGRPGVGKSAVLDLAAAAGPTGGAGGPGAAPPRRSRGRGRTRRCSRRSATCAASTRRCSTGWTTSTGTRSSAPCPGGTSTWSGESGHQRLFVAVAELVRLAAAGHGLLLVVDDLHEADEASLRLLHYLSRCRRDRARCCSLLAHRPAGRRGRAGDGPRAWSRGAPGPGSSSPRWTRRPPDRLLADRFPELAPDVGRSRSGPSSAGLPFTVLELAALADGRAVADGSLPRCRPRCCGPSSGSRCSARRSAPTSCSPCPGVGEDEAYRHLEAALAAAGRGAGAAAGYRFRHALVRERRWSSRCRRTERDRGPACRSPSSSPPWGQPPGRVAHQLPGRRAAVAGGALRAAGRRDGRRARCLPRRPRPGRRGPGHAGPATTWPACWPGAATC